MHTSGPSHKSHKVYYRINNIIYGTTFFMQAQILLHTKMTTPYHSQPYGTEAVRYYYQ